MSIVVMAIEGVLTDAAPRENNLLLADSSTQGKELYQIFRDGARLLMLSEDPEKDRAKAWMARERFSRYADIHCYPVDSMLSPALWRVQHIKDLMGIGHHISFFVDSDPTAVGMVLEAGVGAMLVVRPGDTPGKRGSDMDYQSWQDLVDTIEAQNMLRAMKTVEATDG
jgi:hypothetical protein